MGLKVKLGWMVLLLSVVGLAASGDHRLAEAVKNKDQQAIHSLLQQHADVNARLDYGATALSWAAHWDDLGTAGLLIRAGANVNLADESGVTPLSLACSNGNSSMVEMLLKAGANPKMAMPTGETTLMTCARGGNVDAVKMLLARGVDVNAKGDQRGQTALMWAVAEKRPDVVRALIEHGADVNARSKGGFTPLLFAARQGDLESARLLVASGANVNETAKGESALLIASGSGQEAVAIFLLEKGANPDAADEHGITPLHYAFLKGLTAARNLHIFSEEGFAYYMRPDMLGLTKALLAHGANPNVRLEKEVGNYGPLMGSSAPVYLGGATPLMLAAATGDVAGMRLLAAAGADARLTTTGNRMVNTQGGTTALMLAARGGSRLRNTPELEKNLFEAVKLAVELGCDVNAADNEGQTALHYAAYRGIGPIVQFLVEKGAKIDVKDQYGQTPLSIAEGIIPEGMTDRSKAPNGAHKNAADLLRKLGSSAPSDLASAHQTP